MTQGVLKLNDILHNLREGTEKTAEDASADGKKPEETTDKSKAELKEALAKSTSKESVPPKAAKKEDDESEEGSEKAASYGPMGDLEKIAHEVASAEEEAIVKEAQLYGAAVCDGFMSRLGQYEEASGEIASSNEKVAYYQPQYQPQYEPDHDEIDFDKLAEQGIYPEDIEAADELVKQAAADGYSISYDDALEKVAHAAYEHGYEETLEKAASVAFEDGVSDTLEKAAEVAYNDGFEDTMEKTAQLLKEAGELEAVEAMEKAAFESGYEDAMEKIASSAFEQGVHDMENLINQVA